MLRFDRFIRPSMTIREVKQQYPDTNPVFEQFGFRPICDDCSIEVVAQRQGLPASEIVEALDRAIVPSGGYHD